MKNKKFKILLVIIMILSVIPIFPKAEETTKKGDLRCPKTTDGSKYCKEYRDNNGTVYKTEVTVSDKDNNVEVIKVVEKEEKIGQYSVYFKVDGIKTKYAEPYIVVLFDTSGSVKNAFDTARDAIIEFSSKLQGYNLALVQFAANVSNKSKNRGFVNTSFTKNFFSSYGKDGMGTSSHVEKGLNKAYSLLKDQDKSAPKYIILFGDGEYNFKNGTSDWEKMNEQLNNLKKIENLQYVGIRFPSAHKEDRNSGSYTGDFDPYKKLYPEAINLCQENIKNINDSTERARICNIATMNYIINSNGKALSIYTDSKEANWKDDFLKVADDIKKSLDRYSYSYLGQIDDKIGSDFSPSGTKNIVVENLNEFTDKTTININNDAETGWHNTNDGFTYTYKYTNNNETKTIHSNINPEVYWEQEKGWQSCSDYASSSSDSSYVNDYIERTCSQIDGDGMRGFYALLTTNGKPINTKMISLTSGTGFPLTVDIESRVQCTYKFNVDNFNNKLQEISNTKNSYEKASKTKELIQNVESYVNSSLKLDNLQKYQKSLDTLDAVLQVKFKSSTKDIKLQSSSPSINEIKCSSDTPDKSITLDGKRYDVYTNRNCVFKYKKSLNIPTHCLSMYNGNMEECSATANNLINGGNKFYPDTNETSGYISVTLKNATYAGSTINLKGDKKSDGKNYDCQLSLSPIKPVIYRQIELADPFVQSYTKNQRSIGKNWINSNYNFVNIIKSDIWDSSKNYDYQYLMSKVDVENIKKDTKEIGIKSYLGRNCSFNSNNKYVCEFVRPNSSGKNQFFYKISGKALNISNE